jgi:hypothetical protein
VNKWINFLTYEMPGNVGTKFLPFIQNPANWSKREIAKQAVQAIVKKIVDVPSGLRYLLVAITLMATPGTIERLVLDFLYLVRLCKVYEPNMFKPIIDCQHLMFRGTILDLKNHLMDSKLGEFVDNTKDEVTQLVYSHWQRVGLEFLSSVEDTEGSAMTKEEQFKALYTYVSQMNGKSIAEGPFNVAYIHKLEVKVMHQILGPAVSFLCAREDTGIIVEFQRALNEMEIVTPFDLYIRADEVIDYSVGEFDPVKKEETAPPAIGFLSNKKETAQQFLDWYPQLNAVLVDLDKGTSPYKVSVYIETVPHSFTVEEYSKRMEQILSIENVKGVIFTVEDDVDGNKWELYQFLYAISCLYEQFVCIRMMSDCTIKWIEMFLETLRVWSDYY